MGRLSTHPSHVQRRLGGLALASVAVVLCFTSAASGAPSAAGKTVATVNSIVWAEPASNAPNCIFQLGPLTCSTVANASSFQALMFRPLYWLGKNGGAGIDSTLSIANTPVFSAHDRVVTIKLKPYHWSNGAPVTARDVEFMFNLVKANKKDWEQYSPGSFPDTVLSAVAVNSSTLKLKLNKSWNPTWFLYTQLTQLEAWPVAWDIKAFPAGVTATSGQLSAHPKTLPDSSPAGARAVAKFLEGQAKNTANYVKSPLWTIVDGPWKLTTFANTGLAQFTRNSHYGGPTKNQATTFTEVPFTSESAEFNELLSSRGSGSVSSGNSTNQLSVGYIPPSDLSQQTRVTQNGYGLHTQYGFGFDFFVINMQNKSVGPILRQLYIRQALQHLVDQPTWIKTFMGGIGVPVYGPVPLKPTNTYLGTHKLANPYPFSLSAATALLRAHGWTVHAGGKTTCATPAKCGAGIKRGMSLTFSLLYNSGDSALSEQMSSLASNANRVGITINLSSGPFSQVTGAVVPICVPGNASTHCAWQMLDWGGWYYTAYPSGEQLFATGANGNYGGWNSKTTNRLINRVETAPGLQSAAALYAYDKNIADNLPAMIFMPFASTRVAAATDLHGYSPSPFGLLDPENW